MTYEDFDAAYLSHVGEQTVRRDRSYNGYEVRYPNGDTYIYDEQLKPGRAREAYLRGYYTLDDFIHTSTWNGEVIDRPHRPIPREA